MKGLETESRKSEPLQRDPSAGHLPGHSAMGSWPWWVEGVNAQNKNDNFSDRPAQVGGILVQTAGSPD